MESHHIWLKLDLREDDLDHAKEDHVRVAGAPARALVVAALGVEAVGPLDRAHADGGCDGVADGHADEVGVLDHAAQPDLEAAEAGPHGVHVVVVPLPRDAVALGEHRGGVVADGAEDQHHGEACRPAQLRHRPRPRQRQHPGPDHRREYVRAHRPHRARPARATVIVHIVPVVVTCLQRAGRDAGRRAAAP
jgi:hypothetical protein